MHIFSLFVICNGFYVLSKDMPSFNEMAVEGHNYLKPGKNYNFKQCWFNYVNFQYS